MAGLQLLPVAFTRGTPRSSRRVGRGPGGDRRPGHPLSSACPHSCLPGHLFSNRHLLHPPAPLPFLLPYSSPCPLPPPQWLRPAHLNRVRTPEPQERSQGPQEDQADQPQDTGQPPGSHTRAPFSHTLQGGERPRRSGLGRGGVERGWSPDPGTPCHRRHPHQRLQLSRRKGTPGCFNSSPTRQGHSERGRQRPSWRRSPGGQRHPGVEAGGHSAPRRGAVGRGGWRPKAGERGREAGDRRLVSILLPRALSAAP